MNKKLLILYMERLLDRLEIEIDKADNTLGPDVHRLEEVEFDLPVPDITLETIFKKGRRSSTALSESEAKPTTTTIGDAVALVSLRDFAESIREDIETLSQKTSG